MYRATFFAMIAIFDVEYESFRIHNEGLFKRRNVLGETKLISTIFDRR